MRRFFLAMAVAVAVACAWPRPAAAFINNVTVTAGEGVLLRDGEATRSRVNLEVIPSVGMIKILRIDLGMLLTVERPVDFWLRPGVRVGLPIIYGRAAIPLRLTSGFDWGFLLGLGSEVVSLGPIAIVLEVDTFLTDDGGFGDVVPIEGRAGLSVGF